MSLADLEKHKLSAMNFLKKISQSDEKEIEYVLTKAKEVVKDVSVINNFSTGSGHGLVRTKVLINLKI